MSAGAAPWSVYLARCADGTLYCTISLYPADRFRYVQALRRTA